jgi:hypothetical protein
MMSCPMTLPHLWLLAFCPAPSRDEELTPRRANLLINLF